MPKDIKRVLAYLRTWKDKEMGNFIRLTEFDTRDHMAMVNNSQEAANNLILSTKKDNQHARKEIAHSMKTDQRIIHEVLADRPNYKSGMLCASARGAIELLHQRVSMARSRLDTLYHMERKRRTRLHHLIMSARRFEELEWRFEDYAQTDRLRKLQNDIDKARIRFETAVRVSKNYERLMDELKRKGPFEEKLAEVVEMTATAVSVKYSVTAMCRRAEKAEREVLKELMKMSETSNSAREARDEELVKTREMCDEAFGFDRKKPVKKNMRQFNYGDDVKNTRTTENDEVMEMMAQRQRILILQDMILELKVVLKASRTSELVPRLSAISSMMAKLGSYADEKRRRRDALRRDLNMMDKHHLGLKHHREPVNKGLRDSEEGLQKKLNDAKRRLKEAEDRRHEKAWLIVEITTGVDILLNKLADINVAGIGTEQLSDHPTVMKLCDVDDRAQELLREVNTKKVFARRLHAAPGTKGSFSSQLWKACLSTRPSSSLFVYVKEAPSTDDHLYRPSHNNEKYMSRQEVKQRSREFVQQMRKRMRFENAAARVQKRKGRD